MNVPIFDFSLVRLVAGCGFVLIASRAAAQVPSGAAQQPAAAASGTDLIRGPSDCPAPAAVWSEIDRLVIRGRLEPRLRALADAHEAIEVVDLGASFRVVAAGRTRDYLDEPRDCAQRARLAALFVALAAGSMGEPAAPPRPVVTAPPASPVDDSRLRRWGGRLEIGATFEAGLPAAWPAAGAGLRLALGRDRLGLVAGVRGYLPLDGSLAEEHLESWRAAADLLLRATFWRDRRIRPFVELGATGTLLSVRATDLASARDDRAFEIGVLAGAGLHVATRGPLSPYVSLRGEVIPRPATVFARPAGALGDTPLAWLGASVGCAIGIF